MKKAISFCLILITSFCFSQTKQEISNYLESKFGLKDSINLGGSFYDVKDEPELYVDDLLKKTNPELSFYLFVLNERGCYGLSPRKSILITENGKISFIQLGIGLMINDKGINNEFVALFNNKKLRKTISIDEYTDHIAKLIFKMYFDFPYQINKTQENAISYYTHSNGSIIFDLHQNKIQNIRFQDN